MSENIIQLSHYKVGDYERLVEGLSRLDDALSYFDGNDDDNFYLKSLAGLTYIAIRFGENIKDEIDKIQNEKKG